MAGKKCVSRAAASLMASTSNLYSEDNDWASRQNLSLLHTWIDHRGKAALCGLEDACSSCD